MNIRLPACLRLSPQPEHPQIASTDIAPLKVEVLKECMADVTKYSLMKIMDI
jgi:hypothetical protein